MELKTLDLKNKKIIAMGERDGVQGTAIARCAESAGAEVVLEVRENAIMVPQVSIVRRPAGDVVYVINAGMAKQRRIERGQRNGDLVEVRTGLTGGERIAVDGAGFLTDGTSVTEVEG